MSTVHIQLSQQLSHLTIAICYRSVNISQLSVTKYFSCLRMSQIFIYYSVFNKVVWYLVLYQKISGRYSARFVAIFPSLNVQSSQ